MKAAIRDALYPNCPIRNVLSRIGDKWSLLVIYTLNRNNDNPIRFGELQRQIPDISQKMLSQTLRTLEEDGMITRQAFAEVPPRVEYSLTDRCRTLIPHVGALINWAQENMDAILQDRMQKSTNILETK